VQCTVRVGHQGKRMPSQPRCAQMLCSRTAEDRAKIDLKLHFMRKTLNEVVRSSCVSCLHADFLTKHWSTAPTLHFIQLCVIGFAAGCAVQPACRHWANRRRADMQARRAPQDRKHGRTRRELLREEYVEGAQHGGIGQPSTGFRVRRPVPRAAARCVCPPSFAPLLAGAMRQELWRHSTVVVQGSSRATQDRPGGQQPADPIRVAALSRTASGARRASCWRCGGTA